MNYGALLPEIALLAGAVIVLLGGSFLPRRRQHLTLPIAWLALGIAVVGATVQAAAAPTAIFTGTFALDAATAGIRILAPASTAMILVFGLPELRTMVRESETVALLLLATLGALVVAGANDLLVLAAGFLLSSIPLYGLIGISRTPGSAEAVMKTYLQGALFGVVMLGGITLLFGAGRATAYSELRAGIGSAPATAVAIGAIGLALGLLFEAGAVPAHFWVPDATQASPRVVAAFLTTVPKLAALVALARLTQVIGTAVDLPLVLALVAAASMTIGNLAALWQQNVRRLLGWSTVSQVGYLLMPLVAVREDGVSALLIYLAGYAVTNLAAFAVLAALPERAEVDDWAGAGRRHPILIGALIIALLSLVGTPPTAVFFGKLAVFIAAWQGGYGWLVVIAAINTVVSLFYYLRWIAAALRPDPAGSVSPRVPLTVGVAVATSVLTLVVGVTAIIILDGSVRILGG